MENIREIEYNKVYYHRITVSKENLASFKMLVVYEEKMDITECLDCGSKKIKTEVEEESFLDMEIVYTYYENKVRVNCEECGSKIIYLRGKEPIRPLEDKEFIKVDYSEVEDFECPYCERKARETLSVYMLGSDRHDEKYEWGVWCNCGSVFEFSEENGLWVVLDGRCKMCGEVEVVFERSELYGKEEEFPKDVRCKNCGNLISEYHIEEEEVKL